MTWTCPACGKPHSKRHYAVEGQIDYNKKPMEVGRVVFNRRHKDDSLDKETPIDHSKPMKGKAVDDEGPRPIYCPHCGYEEDVIVISKVVQPPVAGGGFS